mmetsp:Transcript_35316/g.77183  ORF Transcript_35316/g.77183 Transcript_35316/m.77183 type:complete len:108 (-) Transcript_35316:476-799(-)
MSSGTTSSGTRRPRTRPDTPCGLDNRFMRTKLCSFHAMGKCARGAKCTFAHAEEDVLEQPDLFRTHPCRDFFFNALCRRGDVCPFAHQPKDLRIAPLAICPSLLLFH